MDFPPARWGRAARGWLLALLAVDAGFVALHVANKLVPLGNVVYDLAAETGRAEQFQHLKAFAAALLLAGVAWRSRERLYAVWASLLTYLLLDDATQIHERTGGWLAAAAGWMPMLRLRPQDFGELAVSASVGLLFVAALAACWRQASPRARAGSQGLALLLGLLVFFGVGVDIAHSALPVVGATLVEDGGELFAMSLIVVHALHLWLSARRRGAGPAGA